MYIISIFFILPPPPFEVFFYFRYQIWEIKRHYFLIYIFQCITSLQGCILKSISIKVRLFGKMIDDWIFFIFVKKLLSRFFILHFNYWGKLFMKNSLILDIKLCGYVEVKSSSPPPFPSLLYLSTFHRFSTFPFPLFPFHSYPTLPFSYLPLTLPFYFPSLSLP